MSLSGSSNFNLNTTEICTAALKNLGAIEDGESISNDQLSEARKQLNVMVKQWRADNVMLWKETWLTYPFTTSSTVLSGGVDYRCIRNHTSAAVTEPGVGAQWKSYWILLTTTAGAAWLTATDYTAIQNIAIGSDVIGLGDAFVRSGTTSLSDQFVRTDMTSDEYFGLGNKDSSGKTNQVYFDRGHTNSIFLYPRPDSTSDVLNIEVFEFPEDFDTNTNTPDFLQEWLAALEDGLTLRLYPRYPFGSYSQLTDRFTNAKGTGSYDMARSADSSKGDIEFDPEIN